MTANEETKTCWSCDGEGYKTETARHSGSGVGDHEVTRRFKCSRCKGAGTITVFTGPEELEPTGEIPAWMLGE